MNRLVGSFLRRYLYLLAALALVYGAMIVLSAVDLRSVGRAPLSPGQWEWQAPLFIVQAADDPDGGYVFNDFNQRKILEQAAVNLTLSVGMTFVILIGGIDLSVGSMLSLCNVVFVATVLAAAGPQGATAGNLLLGTAVCVAVGGVCGLANGWLAVALRIPSFIVTLGTLLILEGIAFWVSGGKTRVLACPDRLTVAIPIGVSVLAVAAAWLFLATTAAGRRVYAVGGNLLASAYSGVRTSRVRIMCFTFSGLCAGLGGMIYWSRLSTGSYTAGKGLELYAIAAVVLGGTSLSGGEGSIIGTMLGALIMAVLANGLNTALVDELTQKIIVGCVLVVAACIDSRRNRQTGLVVA